MSRYTVAGENSSVGQLMRDLQPGEEASFVGEPHVGKNGLEQVDGYLYQRGYDGILVRDNRYHTHLDPNTYEPQE